MFTTNTQSFYMRFCNGVHETNQHHFVKEDNNVAMNNFNEVILVVIQASVMQ